MKIANINNLSLVAVAMARLVNRQDGLPGLGVLYGPSGFGKTTATVAIANKTQAYYVQLRSAWSKKTLLEKLCFEMGLAAPKTAAACLDAICEQLAATQRPLILDEADYLLQAEHEGAIHQIRKSLMRDVTVAWISATYGQPLIDLVASGLPLYQVEKDQVSQSGQVDHVYVLTHDRQKVQQLKRLAQVADMQALVFFEQVHDLETVAAKLVFQGIKLAVMHGQLSKQERERAFRLVQQGKVTYLLTTDMAARGLDIPDLPYIVHYNRVYSLDTYVHRSGRTGLQGCQ